MTDGAAPLSRRLLEHPSPASRRKNGSLSCLLRTYAHLEDRLWHTTKKLERLDVAIAESLRRLRRIGHDKDRIRVRQMDRQEVDLAQGATDLG